MKVTVNADMCEGHAKCEMVAPEVFKLGPDDVSIVLVDEVPNELHEKVERAIRLCPRQAIAGEVAARTGRQPSTIRNTKRTYRGSAMTSPQ